MGLSTNRGEYGQPIYNNSAANPTQDFQAAVDFAGSVGNRVVVNNYAEMTTGFVDKFGFPPYDGLECFNLDSGDTRVYNEAAQSWDDPDLLTAQSDSVFSASSGWTTAGGTQKLIRLGAHLAEYYFSFSRDGATIPAGNLNNVSVGTITLPPALGSQPLGPGYSGAAQFMVATTGVVQVTSSVSDIRNGDQISAAGLLII